MDVIGSEIVITEEGLVNTAKKGDSKLLNHLCKEQIVPAAIEMINCVSRESVQLLRSNLQLSNKCCFLWAEDIVELAEICICHILGASLRKMRCKKHM